jgi:hypothetical protein
MGPMDMLKLDERGETKVVEDGATGTGPFILEVPVYVLPDLIRSSLQTTSNGTSNYSIVYSLQSSFGE